MAPFESETGPVESAANTSRPLLPGEPLAAHGSESSSGSSASHGATQVAASADEPNASTPVPESADDQDMLSGSGVVDAGCLAACGDGSPGPFPTMQHIGDIYVDMGRRHSALGEECAALAFDLQPLRDELRDLKDTMKQFTTQVRAEIEELQTGLADLSCAVASGVFRHTEAAPLRLRGRSRSV